MNLYAITFKNPEVAWTEFYWADDSDHAVEQANDSNPGERIVGEAIVPAIYLRASTDEADTAISDLRRISTWLAEDTDNDEAQGAASDLNAAADLFGGVRL